MNSKERISRRQYIGSTGAGIIALTAGCLGDDDGNGGSTGGGSRSGELVLGATPNTSTMAFLQGLASMVNEKSNDVEVTVRPQDAFKAGPRLVAEGTVDLSRTDQVSLEQMRNNEAPYDQTDLDVNDIVQVFNMYDLYCTTMTPHTDWQTFDDIESGSAISLGPRGHAVAELLFHIIDNETGPEDYQRPSVGFDEQATAFNEDRLDVGAFTFLNSMDTLPGWMEQATSVVDLNILELDESLAQNLDENDPIVSIASGSPPDDVQEGFNYVPETVRSPISLFKWIANRNTDQDALHEFLSVMMENREELPDYHSMGSFYTDKEYWVKNMLQDLPFHPAAAEVYEDAGVWQEDFTTPS